MLSIASIQRSVWASPSTYYALDDSDDSNVTTAKATSGIVNIPAGDVFVAAWLNVTGGKYQKGMVKVAIQTDSGVTPDVKLVDTSSDNENLDAIAYGNYSAAFVYEPYSYDYKLDIIMIITYNDGTYEGPIPVAVGTSYEEYGRVAYSSGKYLVIWYDSSDQNIYGKIYNEEGGLVKDKFLITGTGETYTQVGMQLIGFDQGFLLIYRKYDGTQHGVYARVVSLTGGVSSEMKVLDDPNVDEGLLGSLLDPKKAFAGGKAFIPITASGSIVIAVLDPNNPSSVNYIDLTDNGYYPYLTSGEMNGNPIVIVTWTDKSDDSLGNIKAALINATSGTLIDIYDVSRDTQGLKESYTYAVAAPKYDAFIIAWSRQGAQGSLDPVCTLLYVNGTLGPIHEIISDNVDQFVRGVTADSEGTRYSILYSGLTSPTNSDLYMSDGLTQEDLIPAPTQTTTETTTTTTTTTTETTTTQPSTVTTTVTETVTETQTITLTETSTVTETQQVTVTETTTQTTTSTTTLTETVTETTVETTTKVTTQTSTLEKTITSTTTETVTQEVTPGWVYPSVGLLALVALVSIAALVFRGFKR